MIYLMHYSIYVEGQATASLGRQDCWLDLGCKHSLRAELIDERVV
jgi:hypothetical protein